MTDFERSSNVSKTQIRKSIHLNVSFSNNLCLSWVKLSVAMKFSPIPANDLLCTSNQYRSRLLMLKVSWDSVLTNGRYVSDFAANAQLLHQLIEKTQEFMWNSEEQQAFEQLKDCLTSSPILAIPSLEKLFIRHTDACEFAVGAVLAKVQNGLKRVVSYASKTPETQSRYSTTK